MKARSVSITATRRAPPSFTPTSRVMSGPTVSRAVHRSFTPCLSGPLHHVPLGLPILAGRGFSSSGPATSLPAPGRGPSSMCALGRPRPASQKVELCTPVAIKARTSTPTSTR